ncbi:gastrula zinc finger -like protein [Labeo rohita]|uniref:Gastrula zinc finger-like protein n=1 Tax=Labeo rohita TaxID=84645 RepID=A0A498NAM2_LABRO|nr:gastrula zinc finger -like protein [Labeo rohita]
MEEIRQLKTIIQQKDERIEFLEQRVDDLEQYSRVDDLVITGLDTKHQSYAQAIGPSGDQQGEEAPSEELETLEQQVVRFMKSKTIPLDSQQISACYTLPSKDKKTKPKIIVKFASRKHKVEILKEAKKLKVKMDLPTFSNLDSEDPIDFIDRFEEYNELRPLHHEELLAALSEKVWQRLRQKDEQLTKSAQTFMLANGQSQKTQGKVCWQCEIYGVKQEITFYVMEDENLAVPVILGVDFLKKAGVVIDFNASRVYLPDVNSSHPMCFNDVHEPASIQFYVAQGEGAMHNEEELKLIDRAVESSNASAQTYRLTCTISNKCFTVCTRPVSH